MVLESVLQKECFWLHWCCFLRCKVWRFSAPPLPASDLLPDSHHGLYHTHSIFFFINRKSHSLHHRSIPAWYSYCGFNFLLSDSSRKRTWKLVCHLRCIDVFTLKTPVPLQYVFFWLHQLRPRYLFQNVQHFWQLHNQASCLFWQSCSIRRNSVRPKVSLPETTSI